MLFNKVVLATLLSLAMAAPVAHHQNNAGAVAATGATGTKATKATKAEKAAAKASKAAAKAAKAAAADAAAANSTTAAATSDDSSAADAADTTGTASAATVATGATLSAARSFADLSISAGTAGDAAAEAAAKYPFTEDQFATISEEDLDILKTEREIAEAAETDAFNPAVDAASGDAKESLQAGKIKNKVLKLTFEVNNLKIEQAQGADNADKIAVEQKKLDNNIAIDTKSAGLATTDVDA